MSWHADSNKRSWRDRGDDRSAKRQDSTRSGTAFSSSSNPRQRVQTFRVLRPDALQRQEERATLSKPMEIGHFSKDADGTVRFDKSNLLQYKEPPVGANLLAGIESYVSKDELDPDAHPAPLAPLLAALEHFQRSNATHRPAIVTFRNNLNKIMGTPYNTTSEWTMRVEKRNGCVYLDVQRTESDKRAARSPPNEQQRRGAYAGRQFEVLATHANDASDASNTNERVVNEGQEYCGLFATTLGGKRLVVAAELDCYEDKQPSPSAAATDNNSSNSSKSYVELKTFRVLAREKDTYVFERFKLLAFWIQSFLVGVPTIVCGFRTDDFHVQKLQTFATTDLPSYGRKYWHPSVCLNFTSSVLDWLLAESTEGCVYDVSYAPRDHVISMVELRDASFVSAGAAGSTVAQ